MSAIQSEVNHKTNQVDLFPVNTANTEIINAIYRLFFVKSVDVSGDTLTVEYMNQNWRTIAQPLIIEFLQGREKSDEELLTIAGCSNFYSQAADHQWDIKIVRGKPLTGANKRFLNRLESIEFLWDPCQHYLWIKVNDRQKHSDIFAIIQKGLDENISVEEAKLLLPNPNASKDTWASMTKKFRLAKSKDSSDWQMVMFSETKIDSNIFPETDPESENLQVRVSQTYEYKQLFKVSDRVLATTLIEVAQSKIVGESYDYVPQFLVVPTQNGLRIESNFDIKFSQFQLQYPAIESFYNVANNQPVCLDWTYDVVNKAIVKLHLIEYLRKKASEAKWEQLLAPNDSVEK